MEMDIEQRPKKTADRMQILTTLNENYLPRLQVLITSLGVNQPEDPADIWLMHSGIPQNALEPVSRQCRSYGFGFHPVEISSGAFLGAPASSQYPREMYYRLLAAEFLPESMRRILYLDPDILLINSAPPALGDGSDGTSLRGGRPYGENRAGKQHQSVPARHRSQLL